MLGACGEAGGAWALLALGRHPPPGSLCSNQHRRLTSYLLCCPGAGRALAMGHCRLCHGKFSSRSLRSISGRAPAGRSDRPPPGAPGERVFARDFQRLLGVVIHQDPALSQFVCKNCHAQFYQCHGLLRSFLQRVNVSPSGQHKPGTRWALPPSFIWEIFGGYSRHRDEGREGLSVQSRPLGERGQPTCVDSQPCLLPGPAHGHADPLQGWCPALNRGRGPNVSR